MLKVFQLNNDIMENFSIVINCIDSFEIKIPGSPPEIEVLLPFANHPSVSLIRSILRESCGGTRFFLKIHRIVKTE